MSTTRCATSIKTYVIRTILSYVLLTALIKLTVLFTLGSEYANVFSIIFELLTTWCMLAVGFWLVLSNKIDIIYLKKGDAQDAK